jgi:hypothetical protein
MSMKVDARPDAEGVLSTPETGQDVRPEIERLCEHMTACAERVRRDIYALIDAIELLKYIDSERR